MVDSKIELEKIKREFAITSNNVKSLNSQISKLKIEKKSLEEDINKLAITLEKSRKEYSEIENKKAEFNKYLNDEKTRLNEDTIKANEIIEAADHTKDLIEKSFKKIELEKKQNKDLKEELDRKTNELELKIKENEKKSLELKSYEKDLSDEREEMIKERDLANLENAESLRKSQNAIDINNDILQGITSRQDELNKAIKEFEETKIKAREDKEYADRAIKEINRLKNKLDERQKEIDRKEEEIKRRFEDADIRDAEVETNRLQVLKLAKKNDVLKDLERIKKEVGEK